MGQGYSLLIAAVVVLTTITYIAETALVPSFVASEPPIYWVKGANAGAPDVLGKPITVTISPDGTQASVSASLVYGGNQYIDILRFNVTQTGYNVYIAADPLSTVFNTSIIDQANSKVVIWQVGATAPIATVSFSQLSTGDPVLVISALDLEQAEYRVDLIIVALDGVPLPPTLDLVLKLYYTQP